MLRFYNRKNKDFSSICDNDDMHFMVGNTLRKNLSYIKRNIKLICMNSGKQSPKILYTPDYKNVDKSIKNRTSDWLLQASQIIHNSF